MKDTKTVKNKTKASDIIILALIAYLALQIHPIVNYLIVWTPLIDTVKLDNRLWTVIMHVICMAAWAGIALWLLHLSRTECHYPISLKDKAPSAARLCIAAAVAVAFSAAMLIFAGGFVLPYEIGGFTDVLCTAEYYIFLVANSAVFVLIMIFGQKFGDLAFGESNIPWGGIILGIGMAVTNLISGFSSMGEGGSAWAVLVSALVVFVYALVYGAIFVITEKKPLYALPFVALIFVLL